MVVEESQGLVLRLHDGVDLAVVVQVADGQAAAEVQGFERLADSRRGVASSARRGAPSSNWVGIRQGKTGRWSLTCPLAEMRSSQPSLLASRKAMPKPRRRRVGAARPIIAVSSANKSAAKVPEERGGLAVIVGDRQVGRAVAVEIAAGHAHPRLERAARVGGGAGETAVSSK